MDKEDTLQAGMTLSVEAYLREDGVTFGSEEDVVITETGCEAFSAPDPGLFRIGS
jgi:Xaa-Pro aminopeptidase